jgi:hypothetical protein
MTSVRSLARAGISSVHPDQLWDLPSLLFHAYLGFIPIDIKQLECTSDPTPPCMANFKKAWRFTATVICVLKRATLPCWSNVIWKNVYQSDLVEPKDNLERYRKGKGYVDLYTQNTNSIPVKNCKL